MLRVGPVLGRPFNADDEADGHEHVAILTYGFWQRRFGGTPDAIGKTLELSEASYEIDRAGSPRVAVVNQAAAQRYWPGQDPVGQHFTMNKEDLTVVGVVGNIHHLGPEIAPRQECYIPAAQERQFGAALVIRTAGDPMAVLPAVKAAIWSVNREQRLSGDTLTLERYIDRLIAQRASTWRCWRCSACLA